MSLKERPFGASLLRTTVALDEAQSKSINDAIATQRGAIDVIDSQISDLEQRIVDLRNSRQDISEDMTFNEAFLAPIRRAAPEILCKIFGHCLPAEPTHDFPVTLSLMGVCHTWRRIVEETPQLWAQIYVDYRTRLSFVEMFLRNSILAPLDFTLALYNETPETANVSDGDWGDPLVFPDWPLHAVQEDQATTVMETKLIVRVVSEQHRRIRRLNLQAPHSALETFFPSRFTTKTSILEELTIYCPEAPRALSFVSKFRLKGGRLRTLNIHGKILLTTSINRTFGLRRISLRGSVPVSALLQLLRVSSALEELTMKDFRPFSANGTSDADLQFEPILLTKLSLLELDWTSRFHSPVRHSPIRFIRAPVVTSVLFGRYPRPLDDLYNLLTSCSKSIFRLSLDGLNCNPYQFFRIIGDLSALEVLHLANLHVKDMWEILTPEEDVISKNVWTCPRLKTLELRKVDIEEKFLDVVRRRTKPIQSDTLQDGFNYLESVIISQQYVSPGVSTLLGNFRDERDGFSFELRDCRDVQDGNDWGRAGYPY